MKKIILLFLCFHLQILFAGPQYTDIQNSYVTVDFSKLAPKTITINGTGSNWTGILPAQVNSEAYNNNEYIWYDAPNDDKGDSTYVYPYDGSFALQTADIKQFRVCYDSSNVYLFLICYKTNFCQTLRGATVFGIDTDNGQSGNFDLQEGDAVNPALGCASKLRSTKIKCNYTIFSRLDENWGSWFGTNSRIQAGGPFVHSGIYSMKAVLVGGHGGTIEINPENSSVVDMSHATNFKFWVYDTEGHNTIQLRLVDSSGSQYDAVYSTMQSVSNKWTNITIALTNFHHEDLAHIAQIQLYEYNDGIYYFDDLSYDQTSYNTFEKSTITSLWDAQGNLHYLTCQPMGTRFWEIKVPINLIGNPVNQKWHFIAGTGFHENNVFRRIVPLFSNGVPTPQQYWGTAPHGSWDNTDSAIPNVFDLIGAPSSLQVKDLAGYQSILTNSQGNLESLNIILSPNLFNPSQQQMSIGLTVPMTSEISIDVLKLDGEKIGNIFNQTVSPPANRLYEVLWDGKNNNALLKPGNYILKIQYNAQSQSRIIYKYFKIWR